MWKQIVKPPLSTGSSDSQSHLKSHQPERNWRPSGSWGRCKRAGREMAQSTQWSTTVQAVITNNLYPATRKHRDNGQDLGHTYSVHTTRTQVRMRGRTDACMYVRLTRPHPRATSPPAPAPVRGFTLVPDKTPYRNSAMFDWETSSLLLISYGSKR